MKAWIARNRDGSLSLFTDYPLQSASHWHRSAINIQCPTEQDLPEGCNPKWEDKEPIEVELAINLKKG